MKVTSWLLKEADERKMRYCATEVERGDREATKVRLAEEELPYS